MKYQQDFFFGLSLDDIEIIDLKKKNNTLSVLIVNSELEDKGIIEILVELEP